MSKIIIALTVMLFTAGYAYADSIQQITLPSGQNCQVVTIAGQTYVNC
jgi:hypothetical protein